MCQPEIVWGENAVSHLPEVIKSLGGKKVLIVADRNFAGTKIFSEIRENLKKHGVGFSVFDKLRGEPSTELGDECASFGIREKCDIVCGIGGGSTLDTAKAAAVLITNGGSVRDYQGLNKVPGPGLPKIMVPTTAGTGSEVTFTAVFIRTDEKKKGGINSPFLYPETAILDPLLTVTVPPAVTASTGLDALCHAIESFISRKANFLTEAVSLHAIKLIWNSLPAAYENGNSLEHRANMLYGSFLAGVGLANAGVTAVHSISYPLGGVFGVAHGTGNGLLLPYVLEFNMPEAAGNIARIADYPGIDAESDTDIDIEKTTEFLEALKELLVRFRIPRLKELGISPDNFESLALDALKVSVPIENNPRLVTAEDIVEIYRNAY